MTTDLRRMRAESTPIEVHDTNGAVAAQHIDPDTLSVTSDRQVSSGATQVQVAYRQVVEQIRALDWRT